MAGFQRAALILAMTITGLHADSCLILSPPRTVSGNIASFELWLHSPARDRPAAVQWWLEYPPASISGLTVDEGPVLASAGKALFCAAGQTAYRCLAAGRNRDTIANGVVATVIAVLTPGTQTPTIVVRNALGASARGELIPIFSEGTVVTTTCAPELRHKSK